MQTSEFSRLSIGLLLIDIIGAIFMGIGLAEKFGNISIVPRDLRIENFEVLLIGGGFLLTLPYAVYSIKRKMNKKRQT